MGIRKLAEKVADYQKRLESGRASKISASDVDKVLEKLRRRQAELEDELARTAKDGKKERLEHKIAIAREHIARAEWLQERLG